MSKLRNSFVHRPWNSSWGMSHSQNNVTKIRYQTKCKIHEVYIITDYLENKAISYLLNNVWKYQNYALYVTEWKMSKNIKTMKISVWHYEKDEQSWNTNCEIKLTNCIKITPETFNKFS